MNKSAFEKRVTSARSHFNHIHPSIRNEPLGLVVGELIGALESTLEPESKPTEPAKTEPVKTEPATV